MKVLELLEEIEEIVDTASGFPVLSLAKLLYVPLHVYS